MSPDDPSKAIFIFVQDQGKGGRTEARKDQRSPEHPRCHTRYEYEHANVYHIA